MLTNLSRLEVLIDDFHRGLRGVGLAAEDVDVEVSVVLTEVAGDVRRLDHLAEADAGFVGRVSREALDPWVAESHHVDGPNELGDELAHVLLR